MVNIHQTKARNNTNTEYNKFTIFMRKYARQSQAIELHIPNIFLNKINSG